MFHLRINDNLFDDDSLQNVTIRHGSAGPEASHAVPTIEFSINGRIGEFRNERLSLKLNPTLANRYAAYSGGSIAAASLIDRFTGRGASRTVEDRGPNDQTTTITGSNWASLLKGARRTITPVVGERTSDLLTRALNHPSMGNRITTTFSTSADFDRVQGEVKPATISEIVSKYGTDLGIHLQQERSGTIEILPLTRRRALMLAQLEQYRWPILRSEGISPASWAQPTEQADTQYVLEWATANGSEYSLPWPLPAGVTPFMLKEESVEWRHVTRDSGNDELLMTALTITTNLPRTELDSLTIDLIYLLSSGNPYHQRIAAQLLALNEGDAVFLSRDWLPQIRGPYFAQEITETISPDEWTLTLNLSHARKVLGLYDRDIPEVPARVWESARLAWGETNSTWNKGTV